MSTLPLAAAATRLLSGETRARSEPSRAAEFLLVGGLTPLLYLASFLLRKTLGLDAADYAVGFTMFYGAYLINDPHFAVTYLLFYRDGRARAFGGAFGGWQRVRYVLAGLVVPLVLASWAVFALTMRSAYSLGLLVQLMFVLVGWHYVKQGFGVAVVLAARRGVSFTTNERRALLAHAYAGWAYAWANPSDPGTEVEEKGVVYTTIPHSAGLERLALATLLVTLACLLVLLAKKWRRDGKLPLVTPLTAFLCSIWAWSIYSSADPLVRYVVPALHSVQYVYFVWLLRGNEAREREGAPWFEVSRTVRLGMLAVSAVALGAVLFHVAPSMLDGLLVTRRDRSSALGATPYFAALYAFVNIHHFFMDFVIWRRENPETRYLVA